MDNYYSVNIRLDKLRDEIRDIEKEIHNLKVPDNKYCERCGSVIGITCHCSTKNQIYGKCGEILDVIPVKHFDDMISIDDTVSHGTLYYDKKHRAVYQYVDDYGLNKVLMRKWGQLL